MPNRCELLVVLPVRNERAALRKVVTEWFQEIEYWTNQFTFFVIDDGSTDDSLDVLKELQGKFGERLEICSQSNVGHGQTCLRGYRLACEREIPYVFQIDSDGQCDPQYFHRFWKNREQFDVIMGNRVARDDGWRRVVASFVLKVTLLVFARTYCIDANVPYRLMRTSVIAPLLKRISPEFQFANIALAVLLRRQSGIRHGSIPIRFRDRYGGEPSIPLKNFATKAVELVAQLKSL